MPVNDAAVRGVLQNIYWKNLVYSLTIIAFYIFPFLFLKKEYSFNNVKNKFISLKIYLLYSLLTFYLIFLSYFDPLKLELLGNGIIKSFQY